MNKTQSDIIDSILEIAKIPSFSTYEHRLHSFIIKFCQDIGITPVILEDGNIFIETEGNGEKSIALSAHLDKNDYWGEKNQKHPIELETNRSVGEITGLLDDAVGIGICLHLLKKSVNGKYPPLKVLFSVCEEYFFNQYHSLDGSSSILHNNGICEQGCQFYSGMGAEKLSLHLIEKNEIPSALIVIDVTPLFSGNPGIAIYSEPWQLINRNFSFETIAATKEIESNLKKICPRLAVGNNINDYIIYSHVFESCGFVVPCLALEPAVEFYHSPHEKVFTNDIIEVESVLDRFLESFAAGEGVSH